MVKNTYVNAEKGVAVVVLKDRWGDILARGKSVCHGDDTFNEELGIKIANTRAWKKYYEKLLKESEYLFPEFAELADWYTKRAEETKAEIESINAKINELVLSEAEILKDLQ